MIHINIIAARLFDYFDSGVMEGLQHRLLELATSRTQGRLAETPGNSMALTSQVSYNKRTVIIIALCSIVMFAETYFDIIPLLGFSEESRNGWKDEGVIAMVSSRYVSFLIKKWTLTDYTDI